MSWPATSTALLFPNSTAELTGELEQLSREVRRVESAPVAPDTQAGKAPISVHAVLRPLILSVAGNATVRRLVASAPVSPVRSAHRRSSTAPTCPTSPLPSAFTDNRSSHPICFVTKKVPLIHCWI